MGILLPHFTRGSRAQREAELSELTWLVAELGSGCGLAPAAFQSSLSKVVKTVQTSPALDADQTTQGDHQVLGRCGRHQGPSGPPGDSQKGGRQYDPVSWVQTNKAAARSPNSLPSSFTHHRGPSHCHGHVGASLPWWEALHPATCGC